MLVPLMALHRRMSPGVSEDGIPERSRGSALATTAE
jgi:hypothetical protein